MEACGVRARIASHSRRVAGRANSDGRAEMFIVNLVILVMLKKPHIQPVPY
jgi:hypothetical protein